MGDFLVLLAMSTAESSYVLLVELLLANLNLIVCCEKWEISQMFNQENLDEKLGRISKKTKRAEADAKKAAKQQNQHTGECQ
jgi:hypothetical protein